MTGLCSVSVDLDPLWCYSAIHGLDDLETPRPDPIYTRALPRLLELFERYGVRGTFFVVGREAEHPEHVAHLRAAVDAGHELANHTYAHPYNLPDIPLEALHTQIERAHALIADITGEDPVGFRAPGYNIDARALTLIESLGYRYDSSIFPCPPYYLAKGAVMTWIRMRGGRSGSSMVQARTQIAPITPYRPSRKAIFLPGRRDAYDLMELPICVLPGVRFHVIGTSLLLAGPRGAELMCRAAALRHRRHFNLELHGIDLADASLDSIPAALTERQPDLRIGLEQKLDTFERCLARLRRSYQFATCQEAAEALR